jgi:ectoine hydroxylase-related dioxygenase (phytanoyl-CoA dioxygenase family)
MIDPTAIRDSLKQNGFVVLPKVVDASTLMDLTTALERPPVTDAVRLKGKIPFGIRNLLDVVPRTRQLAESDDLMSLARTALGPNAKLVRGLFLDKPPQANWKVAWHQDLTIAVAKRIEIEGFGPWTTKAAVTHVQPPIGVLEGMLALRVHLDDCDIWNGALKVMSGSHKRGRLSQGGISECIKTETPTVCEVPRGGVLLMKPLLLHSSSVSSRPFHRRVIHFEFSSGDLPEGLSWYEQRR